VGYFMSVSRLKNLRYFYYDYYFWDVTPCSWAKFYRRFRGILRLCWSLLVSCLAHSSSQKMEAAHSSETLDFYRTQGDKSQKAALFIITVVRVSDPTYTYCYYKVDISYFANGLSDYFTMHLVQRITNFLIPLEQNVFY
jgi:hypothetical protein